MELKMPKLLKVQEQMEVQEQPKATSAPAGTPKKGKRMANVLEAVLRPMKIASPAPPRVSRDIVDEPKMTISVDITSNLGETGPSGSISPGQKSDSLPEKVVLPTPEAASFEDLEYIIRHASGKQLTKEQITKVQHYDRDLSYPQGSLVYGGGNDEDDYLYCLPDNKEIDVCREMMDNMGYPKLELGLSAMPKDHCADCLAYKNLKVCVHSSLLRLVIT
jgi:hypothetical protein